MAFSLQRINKAKLLLNVSDNEIARNRASAQKLVRAMKHSYLSPIFLLSDGPELHRQLAKKYHIENNFSFGDLLANIFTAPFIDELLIVTILTIAFFAMYWIWLPAWRTSAFNKGYVAGYNITFGADPWVGSIAFQHSCNDNYICQTCQEGVGFFSWPNGTLEFGYSDYGNGGCNYDSIPCPLIKDTWIAATANAVAEQNPVYVDPASYVNGTYLTYYFFGRFDSGGDWDVIICYRARYAKHQAYSILGYWTTSVIFILLAAIVMFLIVNRMVQ